MKKFVLCCLIISVFFGYVNCIKEAEAEESVFSSSTITIISGETGLMLEIKLPDGSIERVIPPWGIKPVAPGKDPEAEKKYKEAIEELEKQLITEEDPEIKQLLCYLYLKVGRNQEAKVCYDQAADIFRNANDIAAQTLAINQAALILWEFGQKEVAIQQAWNSFEVYQQHVKKLRKAEENYQNALESAQETGDQERQLLIQHQLALISYVLGEKDKSKQYVEEVLKLFEKIEYPLMGKQRMEELIVRQMRELLNILDNPQ